MDSPQWIDEARRRFRRNRRYRRYDVSLVALIAILGVWALCWYTFGTVSEERKRIEEANDGLIELNKDR